MHSTLKKRNSSIDVAKGLLILSVVWFHLKTILGGSCGIEHQMFDVLHSLHKGYAIFFMPAFFVITGYCSNFERDFNSFMISNTKGILVPMVILNAIPCLLSFSIEGVRYMFTLVNWLYGLSFWFLPVLFLAKVFFWLICKYCKNKWISLGTSVVCFLLAILFVKYNVLPNYWYWKSALAYVFFIWFGHFFKSIVNQRVWLLGGSIIYLIVISIVLLKDLPVWYLGLSLSCTFGQTPFFLIAAICGSLFVLYISQILNQNFVLEYIGRASLVVYCTHWFIGQHIGKYLLWLCTPDSDIKTILFYIMVFATTVLGCCVFYYIYNKISEFLSRAC